LDVEDWAEIRRLRRSEGMSISQISRVVGLARNTAKTTLNSDSLVAATIRATSSGRSGSGTLSGAGDSVVQRQLVRPVAGSPYGVVYA